MKQRLNRKTLRPATVGMMEQARKDAAALGEIKRLLDGAEWNELASDIAEEVRSTGRKVTEAPDDYDEDTEE